MVSSLWAVVAVALLGAIAIAFDSRNPVPKKKESARSEATDSIASSRVWRLLKHAVYPLKYIDTVGFFTMVLAGVAWLQWRTLEKTDQTLRDQVEAFASQQRAWIKVNASPRSLKFDPISGDATFQYYFRIENVGHSVATEVRVEAKVITIPHEKNPLIDLIPLQRTFCEESIANKATENMDKG